MKFIDLFAGIGGFHQAMKKFNGVCVMSSEIDSNCLKNYELNYNIVPNNDIRNIKTKDIPKHDILLGGFPCQTFSKAGKRKGIEDTRGTLFFEIARILESKKPKYILLENVKNIITHDKGYSWNIIQTTLKNLGYITTKEPLILSPHEFGIPQLRERVFIPAIHSKYTNKQFIEIDFPNKMKKNENLINNILEESNDLSYKISEQENKILNIWNNFKKSISFESLGFPIWIDFFHEKKKNILLMPNWKQNIVNKNIDLYKRNKVFIDNWIKENWEILSLKKTFRKFEWQAGNDIREIWEGIIQMRPSGIRVKRPDSAPTLVAMVQIPIYGPYKRRLTPRECARLQSFPENFKIDKNIQQAYKQFGNSVNVKVVEKILNKLFKQ